MNRRNVVAARMSARFREGVRMLVNAFCLLKFYFSVLRHYCRFGRRLMQARREQDMYSQGELDNDKVVVFVLYGKMEVTGGFLSIFNLAATSRKVLGDHSVLLCIGPRNKDVYSRNTLFPNDEKIWRWSQMRKALDRPSGKLILHIPECFVEKFVGGLSRRDRKALRAIKDLRINILDQNIRFMPSRRDIDGLYDLTENVTQTTAHAKYNSQEICDSYCLPTMQLGTSYTYDRYKRYSWSEKEKLIAYSPDVHPLREDILCRLKSRLPGYAFFEIRKLSYLQYMDLVARAAAVITFGEGMDSYVSEPIKVGTLTLAAYNSDFFQDEYDWCALPSVFRSFEDMRDSICDVLAELLSSEAKYYDVVERTDEKIRKIELPQAVYEDNIRRFYNGEFDYYPTSA